MLVPGCGVVGEELLLHLKAEEVEIMGLHCVNCGMYVVMTWLMAVIAMGDADGDGVMSV